MVGETITVSNDGTNSKTPFHGEGGTSVLQKLLPLFPKPLLAVLVACPAPAVRSRLTSFLRLEQVRVSEALTLLRLQETRNKRCRLHVWEEHGHVCEGPNQILDDEGVRPWCQQQLRILLVVCSDFEPVEDSGKEPHPISRTRVRVGEKVLNFLLGFEEFFCTAWLEVTIMQCLFQRYRFR